jgi:hypothetical protein
MRFKNVELVDINARVKEANLIGVLSNLDFFVNLKMIKIENSYFEFDMDHIMGHLDII